MKKMSATTSPRSIALTRLARAAVIRIRAAEHLKISSSALMAVAVMVVAVTEVACLLVETVFV